uniref:Putative secreted protein n=1 Tax=Rhipicephalus microplus TaxID=6941 RepID=A0A6M2DA65_RHIMP
MFRVSFLSLFKVSALTRASSHSSRVPRPRAGTLAYRNFNTSTPHTKRQTFLVYVRDMKVLLFLPFFMFVSSRSRSLAVVHSQPWQYADSRH